MDFASGCRQRRVAEPLIDGEQKVGHDWQVKTATILKQVSMRFSFKKEDRILKRSDFLELAKSGRKLQNDCMIAFFAPGKHDRPRLGITVTRKVGSAAQRNRIKRLIREYFRLNRQHLKQNWDINIVAKPKAADLSSEKVFSALQDLFEKISNCVV